MEIRVEGMTELIKSFNNIAKEYPDIAGDAIRKEAFDFRKDVVREAKSAFNTNDGNKMSLGKEKNYEVSEVKGIGANQYVEVSAKSPHFHLLEKGHELTDKNGQPVGKGWVQGYLFMDKQTKVHAEKFPEAVNQMADKLLKKEGFI